MEKILPLGREERERYKANVTKQWKKKGESEDRQMY